MPETLANGVRIYYERHGDSGDPLLFVHGYTGDITDWKYQVAEFSPGYRVLVLDLRGHGRSEAPADRSVYTVEEMARDVEAVAEAAGFEKYHLVGHSLGGTIVQEVALSNPQKLYSLTLEDTGPLASFPGNVELQQWNARQIETAEREGMAAVVELQRANMSRLSVPLTPELIDLAHERLARMSVDGFVGATLAGPKWRGTLDRAASIATPTLVICGELDLAPIVMASQWLAQTIPGASLELIPGAGHSPQMEQAELYNRALRRHLEANRAQLG
jgi:pimeloyl-ACP methyl ester carboxylesterase